MTQSKTMRTRYHATRPGGTNGVGWDSSQPSFGSYPIPIPTGGGVDYARHIWMFQLILIRSAVPG